MIKKINKKSDIRISSIKVAIKRVVVHHSAMTRIINQAKMIDKYHRSKGWNGMGYNFLIEKNGDIKQSRLIYEELAQAKGYNFDSVAICFAGSFDLETENLSRQQVESFRVLNKWIKEIVGKKKLVKHSELDPERKPLCPSIDFKELEKEEIENFTEEKTNYIIAKLSDIIKIILDIISKLKK